MSGKPDCHRTMPSPSVGEMKMYAGASVLRTLLASKIFIMPNALDMTLIFFQRHIELPSSIRQTPLRSSAGTFVFQNVRRYLSQNHTIGSQLTHFKAPLFDVATNSLPFVRCLYPLTGCAYKFFRLLTLRIILRK